MNPTTRKLCGLLQSPDNLRRCAGAIALGEVGGADAAAVRALGEALQSADETLAGCILEALEKVGTPAAVPYVLPLLDAPALPMKLRAAAILAKAGGSVVAEIRSRLAQATPAQKPLLVDVLARVRTREAFRALLDLLFDTDFEVVRQTCDAVRRHAADLAPAERASLHREVAGFMKTARGKASERVVTSCLLLLGYLGRPEARAILLRHATPKSSPYLRRHALIGLRNLDFTGAAAAAAVRQLLPYLDEPDDALARNVIDLLARFPGPGPGLARWSQLLSSSHAPVRAFAARKIAEADSPAGYRQLLGLLNHEDTEVREVAGRALAARAGAAPLLVDALAKTEPVETAWMLAKILKAHGEAVGANAVQRLAALAERDIEAGRPRYEPLLYALRNVDAKAADGVLRSTGLTSLRAGRWPQAVEALRRLVNTETFDSEVRYALSIANLKLSPKVLDAHVRSEDHALRGFHALLRDKAVRLAARLTKDKALDAEDLFYVGFHFSEAADADREFGRELLEHVAKRWPKSEQGKAARNRLKAL